MSDQKRDKQSEKDDKQKQELPQHPLFDWRPFIFTLITFLFYYALTESTHERPETISYSEFKQRVVDGRVKSVTLKGYEIEGESSAKNIKGKSSQFVTMMPEVDDASLIPLLEKYSTTIEVKSSELPFWLSFLIGLLPWLLIFGLFAYSNHAIQSRLGGNRFMGFSKSKARLYEKLDVHIGFDEVAGLESAKTDLREVIDYLKHPNKFRKLGAKLPKGILMMGPPGTGKTLLAKATAAEADVPFFSISGSEFVEMFVGVGASRVRSMFEEARKLAPSLIFIDEIDSVGRMRGTGMGGGNDEREQTLNQILAEMDGFSSDEPIIVLAATNRPDVLDPALLRPGRFDRKITLDLPQKKARTQILEVHLRGKPVAEDVDVQDYAARTTGFSGADIENLVNEAALHAARNEKEKIDHADFEYAHDKIILGSVGQEINNDADRKRVAIHEAGHALTTLYSPNADPLTKVSIIPRGRSLGVTETQATEDRLNYSQDYLEDKICVLLGGRCAEKLCLGQFSSGASDDLKQATKLARAMVAQWGMSEQLGPVNYPQHEEHPFLGMEMAQPKDFSDQTARLIDEEVENLIKRKEKETLELISSHRSQLESLATALQEKETLEAQEIKSLLNPQLNK